MRFAWITACVAAGCGGSTVDSDAAGGESPATIDTSTWVEANACDLTFRAPPDIVEEEVQGIDSCVTLHHTSGCSLSSDVGWYSSSLDEFQDFQDYEIYEELIDGIDARIVTAVGPDAAQPYVAGVHMAELSPGSETRATIVASCANESDVEVALAIFRSIRVGAR